MLKIILFALCFLFNSNIFAAELSGKLVLTGSSTVAPLALEIGKRFEKQHPGVRVEVQTGGSSRGIVDARQGVAQIGMVSRVLKKDENDLTAQTIAMDGITIILHRSNAVKKLSSKQIIDIYRGKITNWQELGGSNNPITVVNKAEGRSTLELFLHHFKLKNSDIKAQIIIGDNEQGIKTVAGNPQAIAYVSIGTAEFNAEIGVPIKLLALEGHAATTANVKNKSYPLSRPLNLVFKGQASDLAQSYLKFASSKLVNDLIEEQYFVPVK